MSADVSFFRWATHVVTEGGTLESGEVELLVAEALNLWAENVDLRRRNRQLVALIERADGERDAALDSLAALQRPA